jgi:replication factor C subunit 1
MTNLNSRYNAASHPVPFMKASNMDVAVAAKKADKDVPDLEEALEEEDENDVAEPAEVDDEEELDLKKDKYIKQPKAKGGKKTAKKPAKGAADDDEDDDGGSKPSKAKAKAPAKGKGRPKKA